MPIWSLFIDETGDFRDPDAAVAVGGVLFRDDRLVAEGTLRRLLGAAVGWAQWPLHAAHLNAPVYHVLAGQARLRDGAVLSGELGVAFDTLVQREPTGVRRQVELIREGRFPPIEELQAQLLRLPGYLQGQLWARVRRTRLRIRDVMHELALRSGDPLAGGISLVAAGAPRVEGVADSRLLDSQAESKRYLATLEACLRRAVRVVSCSAPGAQDVRVFLAVRDVYSEVLGQPSPMHYDVLRIMLRELNAEFAGRVRSVQWLIDGWHSETHAGLVLADLAVNRVRVPIGVSNRAIADVETSICADTALPIRTSGSHLAGHGPSAEHARWAIEERNEWAALPNGVTQVARAIT